MIAASTNLLAIPYQTLYSIIERKKISHRHALKDLESSGNKSFMKGPIVCKVGENRDRSMKMNFEGSLHSFYGFEVFPSIS